MNRLISFTAVSAFALILASATFGTTAVAQERVLSDSAKRQIEAVMQEKASRTPVQRKISSHLLYEMKRQRGHAMFQAVPALRSGVKVDRAGRTMVDIKAEVTEGLLRRIEQLGGSVVNSFPQFQAVRASMPLMQLEALAGSSQVMSVRPAARAMTNKNTSEGDIAHGAALARLGLSIDGTGAKVCVLSDSVDHLASVQATGDLPAGIDILPGQDGLGLGLTGEGTAMLEIVHDLAPGAELGFATAFASPASFAQNILDLRSVAGCDVIVDDVIWFNEPVFQDGIIAQAVDTVVADGAVYFSSAGNFGNLNDGSSSVWEGDYADSGESTAGDFVDPDSNTTSGRIHDFGALVGTNTSNQVLGLAPVVTLQWSDPFGASANDYDLCVLNDAMTLVFECSTNSQTGTEDPFEFLFAGAFPNDRLVVINRGNTAAPRYLHMNAIGGALTIATAGQTWGHSAAKGAFSVAAVDWAQTCGGVPCAFAGTESVEGFSSDGPRRVFFNPDGTEITLGDVSATGGELRQKPDIAAADGVSTATPGFGTFFGTSAAAPHAAAIAGLMLSQDPLLTPAQIRDMLTTTALDIEGLGVDRDSGFGIADAFAALGATPPPPGTGPAVALDFNADSMADIVWRNTSNGATVMWQMNGFVMQAAQPLDPVPTAWKVEDIGDFDGDGKADILWRKPSTGANVIWQMDGFTMVAAAQIQNVGSDWTVAGVADFDGDGKADILWRKPSTGANVIWQMDGFTLVAAAQIDPVGGGWAIKGLGDFNGDGRSDILWRKSSTGATVVWQMDGFTRVAGASIGNVGGAWKVEGLGDFDGGGQADILWRNSSTGKIVIWQMNGFTLVAAAPLESVSSSWLVARVADYNGGGQSDILWNKPSTGANVVWQMSGLTRAAGQSIGSVTGSWRVQ